MSRKLPQMPQDNFLFNSDLCNPLYSNSPPPVHINNLYQVNRQPIEVKKESQMTNLNTLTRKWGPSHTMHDTPENYVRESNTHQNIYQGPCPTTYDSNLSPHHDVSSTLENNRFPNSNATFHTLNPSEYPKINERTPIMHSSNLPPHYNISRTIDKNRFLNSNPTFNTLNSYNYHKFNNKSRTIINSNLSPRHNISSALDSKRFHNNEATLHNINMTEYPKINEKKPVMPNRNLSSTLDSNHFLNQSASLDFKDSSGNSNIKNEEGIQRSSSYYYKTQSKEMYSIGNRYVDVTKTNNFKPQMNEFIVNNKDFPELPNSKPNNFHSTMSSIRDLSQQSSTNEKNELYTGNINNEIPINNKTNFQINNARPQIQIFPDGNAINHETPRSRNANTNFQMNDTRPQMQAFPDDRAINNGTPSSSNLNTKAQMNNIMPQIQSFPDGKITNIPGSMLRDQYGIASTVASMRNIDFYPLLSLLNIGEDLTTFGLNMNSPKNICPNFAGPYHNSYLGPNHIDYDVPPEYRIQDKIKNRLAPIKLDQYDDSSLFYIFYSHHCDFIQLYAADELYARNWRFHTELGVWITNVPGMNLLDTYTECEEGTFYVFDTEKWRQVPRQMILDCSKLERRFKKK